MCFPFVLSFYSFSLFSGEGIKFLNFKGWEKIARKRWGGKTHLMSFERGVLKRAMSVYKWVIVWITLCKNELLQIEWVNGGKREEEEKRKREAKGVWE